MADTRRLRLSVHTFGVMASTFFDKILLAVEFQQERNVESSQFASNLQNRLQVVGLRNRVDLSLVSHVSEGHRARHAAYTSSLFFWFVTWVGQ